MRVRFGDFVLDRATRQLLKNGEVRPLEPKAYQLLDLLISRRPAAVSKQEIRDGLWPDTFVSESHLSSLAARMRRALDTGGEGPGFVRTVHGFGYAFGAEATEEERKPRPQRAVAQIEWDRDVLPLMEGENVIGARVPRVSGLFGSPASANEVVSTVPVNAELGAPNCREASFAATESGAFETSIVTLAFAVS